MFIYVYMLLVNNIIILIQCILVTNIVILMLIDKCCLSTYTHLLLHNRQIRNENASFKLKAYKKRNSISWSPRLESNNLTRAFRIDTKRLHVRSIFRYEQLTTVFHSYVEQKENNIPLITYENLVISPSTPDLDSIAILLLSRIQLMCINKSVEQYVNIPYENTKNLCTFKGEAK